MSSTPLKNFAELREQSRTFGPKRVCVVAAQDAVALEAAAGALRLGIATPILVGDYQKILDLTRQLGYRDLVDQGEIIDSTEPAQTAAQMAGDGQADILLKGKLRSDQLLKAVLDKAYGLRTGRLLSDVLLYEDSFSGETRLVGITDGGMNVAPTLEQKQDIVRNAIEVLRAIGIARPRIAIMSATEAVSEALPSTVEAAELTRMGTAGLFGEADIQGPLALDNALLMSAAEAKGISGPVAGRADCLVAPTIEAGNFLGKSAKFLLGSACAHVVVGARVPILIPSRVESAEDKLNAIALGVIHASR